VWQLIGDKVIGTVHVVCLKGTPFMKIANKVKSIFHNYGIHASTVQPEFVSEKALKERRKACLLDCIEESCLSNNCCPTTFKPAVDDETLTTLLESSGKIKRRRKS